MVNFYSAHACQLLAAKKYREALAYIEENPQTQEGFDSFIARDQEVLKAICKFVYNKEISKEIRRESFTLIDAALHSIPTYHRFWLFSGCVNLKTKEVKLKEGAE